MTQYGIMIEVDKEEDVHKAAALLIQNGYQVIESYNEENGEITAYEFKEVAKHEDDEEQEEDILDEDDIANERPCGEMQEQVNYLEGVYTSEPEPSTNEDI